MGQEARMCPFPVVDTGAWSYATHHDMKKKMQFSLERLTALSDVALI